jgi:hypothetical protein
MNIRKIKLALSVGLMNQEAGNAVNKIERMMDNFREDVGDLIGRRELGKSNLNRSHVQQTYALQFERCTLKVDLVSNLATNTQVVNTFSFS